MKICSLILTFLLFSQLSKAQLPDVGTLRKKIELAPDDTSKVLLLGTLSGYYNNNHLDSGLYLVRQMITLSQKLNYPYGEALGLSILATSADRTGDMAKSLEISLNCLHLSEKLTYGKNEIECRAYTQIGLVNFLTGHFDDSRMYLHRALFYAKELYPDPTSYYQIYAHLGNAFRRQGLLDSSEYYTRKAYTLSPQSAEKIFYPYVYNCEGDINNSLGKIDTAKHFFRIAIEYGLMFNHEFQLSYSYSQMSAIFNKEGNPDSSIFFAKKSLALSDRYYFGTFIPDATNELASAFEKLHQPDSALKYLQITMNVKDKVMNQTKQQQFQLLEFEEQQRQQKILTEEQQFRVKVRTLILLSALIILIALMGLLYRNNRNKQKSNAQLLGKTKELQNAMQNLRETQSQLVQSEKMASLGELTAGIAHEIQNPLNFVNNFSEVNTELIDEAGEEINKGNIDEVKNILNDIKENEQKINHHGKRAGDIVKGMLQHSRSSTGVKEPTDINALADEYFRISYQGLRAKDKSFNATMKTDFDETIGKINIIPQDIGRVFLNLFNNAFYAVSERQKAQGKEHEPTVSLTTKELENHVIINVSDNGNGISQKIVDKIFQPFFTTKPTGQGTGLGLSLSYDIVKAHGGEIKVESKEEEGTE
ncbi:MAG: ATP-binding protein, partial [Ginsengibacter sp.]